MLPADLLPAWTARAAELEPYAPAAATAFRTAAAELGDALRAAEDEVLTLGEAAEASGYSERRIRELLATGAVRQAGRKGAPRIMRKDLPKRAGRGNASSYDAAGHALAILSARTQ